MQTMGLSAMQLSQLSALHCINNSLLRSLNLYCACSSAAFRVSRRVIFPGDEQFEQVGLSGYHYDCMLFSRLESVGCRSLLTN